MTIPLEESASFILFHEIIGAISGFVFGTIDALLGGKSFGEALITGIEDAAWGIIFGALISTLMCFGTIYAGCVIALQIFRGAFLVMGGIGTLISGNEGHPAQAVFRGIFALISFHQMGKAINGVDLIRITRTENTNAINNSTDLIVKTTKEISELTRSELKNATPKGWDYQEHNGRVHIKDDNSNYRVRIDPPDKNTPYTHIHILDENGNPLDINGNIVSRKDSTGHIPYKH